MTAAIPTILQAALKRLQQQNRSVSLRSLAAQLGLSSSYVSKIFRGERPLPAELLGRLAKRLQLDHHEVAEIQRLLVEAFEKEKITPTTGIRRTPAASPLGSGYASLGKDDFWLLETWYYLPLLNLVTTKSFKAEPAFIARRLGITELRAAQALERLIATGHLRKDEAGQLARTDLKLRFPTQRSHQSVRAFHQAMIQRALPMLARPSSEEEFAERLISGITLAGDASRLPEAKVVIEEALYRAAEILANGPSTEVMQINLQLFKLSRPI